MASSTKHEPVYNTIDTSFFLSKSHFAESGCGLEPTHLYNGCPTAFTDLRVDNLQLDPHRAATLRRSTFLPYDGVLYEINDAPGEEDALWSYNGRNNLNYAQYQAMLREEARQQLKSISVKQHETKTVDYSKSPHRPLQEFFKVLVDPPSRANHHRRKLRLLIPPSLVNSDGVRAIYYTDPATGCVTRLQGEQLADMGEAFLRKLFLDGKGAPGTLHTLPESEMPVGVIKRMSSGKNEVTMSDIHAVLSALRSQVDGAYVLQKFIKPRGAHAAVYRTTWRRQGLGPSTTVLVSSMKTMRTTAKHLPVFAANSLDLHTNTVLGFRGKAATETQKICADIVDFIEHRGGMRCQFDVFVGDFLHDERERWWFLQAKSFVCRRAD